MLSVHNSHELIKCHDAFNHVVQSIFTEYISNNIIPDTYFNFFFYDIMVEVQLANNAFLFTTYLIDCKISGFSSQKDSRSLPVIILVEFTIIRSLDFGKTMVITIPGISPLCLVIKIKTCNFAFLPF
jgi:hypothetical protein